MVSRLCVNAVYTTPALADENATYDTIDRFYTASRCLQYLWDGWWRQLCREDSIPESTRDAKPVLVIHEVMLEMVLLQLAVVER